MEKNTKAITAKTVTAKTAAPVKKEVEIKQETLVFDTAEKPSAEKKVPEKKPTAKKTTAKKTTAKKTAKTVEKIEEIYVQFAGQEVLTQEVMKRAKEAYVADGHRESSIKSIRLYIKPEENMAYYVINEKIAGGVQL